VEALYSRLPSEPGDAIHIGGLAAEREA
jgi:hypothetical protein